MAGRYIYSSFTKGLGSSDSIPKYPLTIQSQVPVISSLQCSWIKFLCLSSIFSLPFWLLIVKNFVSSSSKLEVSLQSLEYIRWFMPSLYFLKLKICPKESDSLRSAAVFWGGKILTLDLFFRLIFMQRLCSSVWPLHISWFQSRAPYESISPVLLNRHKTLWFRMLESRVMYVEILPDHVGFHAQLAFQYRYQNVRWVETDVCLIFYFCADLFTGPVWKDQLIISR